jgi:protocatechuate 3,4-dioxygenase beta subunit
MIQSTRRDFLHLGLGATAGGLLLPAAAQITEASGGLGSYASFLEQEEKQAAAGKTPGQAPQGPQPPQGNAWRLTEDNILGPYHRANAPFRAKITPPLEAGTVLLISGRVWGFDTRRPLENVVVDIWQANAEGRYDNDDPQRPPAANVFVNRSRLITDATGYYEYETIHPGAYRIGANAWRPPHIHYMIRHPQYRQLVTQLYFRGDPHQATDDFIRQSLIIDLAEQRTARGTYKRGTFDIILAAR